MTNTGWPIIKERLDSAEGEVAHAAFDKRPTTLLFFTRISGLVAIGGF